MAFDAQSPIVPYLSRMRAWYEFGVLPIEGAAMPTSVVNAERVACRWVERGIGRAMTAGEAAEIRRIARAAAHAAGLD